MCRVNLGCDPMAISSLRGVARWAGPGRRVVKGSGTELYVFLYFVVSRHREDSAFSSSGLMLNPGACSVTKASRLAFIQSNVRCCFSQ